MNYFDYLGMTGKKDTKENFISYLVDILDYTENKAIEISKIHYRGEN